MALGIFKLDNIDKLRGCFLTSKENPSVLVEPNVIPNTEPPKKKTWQWMLDEDYAGSVFAPKKLLTSFQEDKENCRKEQGPLNHGVSYDQGVTYMRLTSMGWPPKRSRVISGKLFVHMKKIVASNHGWHKGSDIVPSAYLDVEMSPDQVDLLNPTPRDVQLGQYWINALVKK